MWDRALGYSRKASGTGQALLFTTSCHRIAINLSKVIFIDEIDSLCRLRNSLENDSTRRIKTELLIQMEAAERYDKANIFLLCATNCPWELDKAFLCRFQKRIYIPLPNNPSETCKMLHAGEGQQICVMAFVHFMMMMFKALP
ncbi:hypothetical protein RRG08_005202 [Elysia crispata]|uniref:ATPase AAA-type core domain-containing protein n=1 Tax=Elysia crispata TaxID=231223 RepID=A0AAE0XSY8_9GAST|nr:hypothetical protein RRG08_005202 [Elysia crispata]